MRYLLDANALLALGQQEHSLHARTALWLRAETKKRGRCEIVTCAITELAFVRILTQTIHGYSVAEAKALLATLKTIRNLSFLFVADDVPASRLPAWVRHPRQVTDGHLLALAESQGALLVTLDEGIPGAFLIPR